MIKSGIYKITKINTNEFYIGSSCNIKKRWQHHLNDFKDNRHSNSYLQRIYNKYGKNIFRFEILVSCPKQYLIKLEQWFIDNLKPKYNLCPNASGMSGYKQTKEHIQKRVKSLIGRKPTKKTRLRISKSNLGRKHSPEHIEERTIRNRKKIYQYDLSGNFIKEWRSIIEAMRFFKCSSINRAYRGIGPSAIGFIWIDKKNKKEIQNRINRIKRSKPIKYIYQLNLLGKLLNVFQNMKEVEDYLEIKEANKNIHNVCTGKRKTAYGYKWKKIL